MKICHVCNAECEDVAELCPVCGAVLREISEEEKKVTEITAPTLLASIEDAISAEIFKDVLTDNEILFSCNDEDNALRVTFGGGIVSVDIYVDESDFDKAKDLYEEFLKSEEENSFFFEDEEFEEFTEEEI